MKLLISQNGLLRATQFVIQMIAFVIFNARNIKNAADLFFFVMKLNAGIAYTIRFDLKKM